MRKTNMGQDDPDFLHYSRPFWYDRNPVNVIKAYTALTVGPHTITTRWGYTVPSGKKAFLESAVCYLRRTEVATTVGRAVGFIDITPAGQSPQYYILAEIITNNVGDSHTMTIGHAGILLAGDRIRGRTADHSTGGSLNYYVVAKIIEFDA